MIPFPKVVSFTITNKCNLSCKVCGQWGARGYLKDAAGKDPLAELPVDVWKRLVDEVAAHAGAVIAIRGGEPFLYPGIIELLSYIKEKGLFVSMDTNGSLLSRYAEDIVRLKIDHITLSVDGPEEVHDRVRGVTGSFRKLAEGVARVRELSLQAGRPSCIGAVCCVISPESYEGLAAMPDVVRRLGIPGIAIVPYYYCNAATGKVHEKYLKEELGCERARWKGFQSECGRIDTGKFLEEFRKFKAALKDVALIPFMPFAGQDYVTWFTDCTTSVGRPDCGNPWRLVDIQPDGDANFCVDFPDYILGNITHASIEDVWNSPAADRFRRSLTARPLPLCARCGAKYMV